MTWPAFQKSGGAFGGVHGLADVQTALVEVAACMPKATPAFNAGPQACWCWYLLVAMAPFGQGCGDALVPLPPPGAP